MNLEASHSPRTAASFRRASYLLANGWVLLPTRVVLGVGFIVHGYAKLARGPEHFADVLTALGLPVAGPLAWATTVTELLGGAALVAGAWVAPVSVPLAAIMLTAMVTVHARYGFSSVRLRGYGAAGADFGPVGYELNLVYLAGLFALALGDNTALSVDRWLAARRAGPREAAR